MHKVEIETRDGQCPAYVHHPDGAGPWPAVLMYMDGPGIRPAMQEIAERLAHQGFYVLLPDLFYRAGPYEPVDVARVWADPALRAQHRDTFMASATPRNVMSDTEALLDHLASQPQVLSGPVGIVGYCMGGRLALIAAGSFTDRIAAAASYHGGGLANDTPSSPHLLAPRMSAKLYVAGATNDPNFPDDMKQRLADALSDAGVEHKIETYPAKHGWVLRDMLVHDPAETEHHWQTLVPFLESALKS